MSILPTMSEFHARLCLSGWQFVQSYSLVIFIACFSKGDATGTLLLLTLAVTLLNLAQAALNARVPHFEGMRCRPDMSAMPRMRRYVNYGLEGLHWTVLMLAFFSVYEGLNGAGDITIWLCAGAFFTLGTGFFAERSLRTESLRRPL